MIIPGDSEMILRPERNRERGGAGHTTDSTSYVICNLYLSTLCLGMQPAAVLTVEAHRFGLLQPHDILA